MSLLKNFLFLLLTSLAAPASHAGLTIETEEKAKAEVAAKAEAEAKAKAHKTALTEAIKAIQKKVKDSWIRPFSASPGKQCTLQIRLTAEGEVLDATVISSSGDKIFDYSAEKAVMKASPLPVPKDLAVFNKHFNPLKIAFTP